MKTFDIKELSTIIGGDQVVGMDDGESISYEPGNTDWVLKEGADGSAGRVKTNSRTGMLTLTLLKTSPFNSTLADKRALDKSTPGGSPFSVLVKDNLGDTKVSTGDTCWIEGNPTAAFANNGVPTWEWSIQMTEIIEDYLGGN